jgi:hypothetical protein
MRYQATENDFHLQPGALVSLVAAALVFLPATALANPHPLPFSYGYATLPKGDLELEQFVDLTPVVAPVGGDFAMRTGLTTELETGLSDRLELGLYFSAKGDPVDETVPLVLEGIKQRLRLRLAQAGAWPIDVSLYGELAELHDAVELETKINLERRFGAVQVLANLSGEREQGYSGGSETELNPSGGFDVQVVPSLMIGAEYWLHAALGVDEDDAEFAEQAHHYVGPTVMWQGERLWWSAAPYIRLDSWDRAGEPGDEYGHVWFRTAVGIDL